MKILMSLILTSLALSLAAHGSTRLARGKPAASPHRAASMRSMPQSGTIIAIDKGKPLTLLITGTREGQPSRVRLGPGSKLVSADGRGLHATSLRLGDQVMVAAASRIVDRSQRAADIRGLVSFAPDSSDAPIVLALQHSQGIVVDLSPRTHYTDRSHETSTPVQAEDGDLLDVRGILDSALSEMTQTDTVARLGPFLHHLPRHGKNGG